MHDKLSRIQAIGESTMLSVGLVIAIVLATVWLANVNARGEASAKRIDELATKQDEYVGVVRVISERLSRIEGAVGVHRGQKN